MKALLIKPKEKQQTVVEVESHEDILKHLEVSIFSVTYRQIGQSADHVYCIYIDDLGLYREEQYVSAWGVTDGSTLVGNLLITKPGEDGEDESLTQSDIDYILSNTHNIIDLETGQDVEAIFPIFYPTDIP